MASSFTLTYISIDRYMCICFPKIRHPKTIHPGWIILILWIISFLFTLPFSIYCDATHSQTSNSCDCYSRWPSRQQRTAFKFATVIFGFYIPFLIILFSYSQICIRLWGRKGERSSIENDQSGKKKRSIKMMILTTSLFFISWFPYTVLYLMKQMKAGDPLIVG